MVQCQVCFVSDGPKAVAHKRLFKACNQCIMSSTRTPGELVSSKLDLISSKKVLEAKTMSRFLMFS